MFSFVQSRPPLVLFFLCIFTLAVTIFCYAFYIKNTDPIPDSDRKYDWLKLLRHFDALSYCLELNGNVDFKKEVDDSFVEMTTVQTLVSLNSTEFKKFTKVQGVLTLDDWHTNCPKSYAKPNYLQIYFDVPELARSNATQFDVCVTIKGPEEYLPKFSSPNCNISNEEQERSKKLEAFLTTSARKLDETFCKTGSLTKFDFNLHVKDNFANFLSDNEKSLIYIHLLWTSYFLVFVLLLIIIYGTLQSDYVYDKYLNKWVLFRNN